MSEKIKYNYYYCSLGSIQVIIIIWPLRSSKIHNNFQSLFLTVSQGQRG